MYYLKREVYKNFIFFRQVRICLLYERSMRPAVIPLFLCHAARNGLLDIILQILVDFLRCVEGAFHVRVIGVVPVDLCMLSRVLLHAASHSTRLSPPMNGRHLPHQDHTHIPGKSLCSFPGICAACPSGTVCRCLCTVSYSSILSSFTVFQASSPVF